MHFRSRVGYVDGLRAIAVLGVVASHSWPWFHYGQRGVDLFFVLSGFSLSYPTLLQLHSEGLANFDVAAFAARRLRAHFAAVLAGDWADIFVGPADACFAY